MIAGISQILFQVLALFYQLTHNYGVSIILFACAVKLILYPLTQQQFKAMKEMQAVQPELQKLQERYKDDPQTLNKAMMDFYRAHKINPLGGCLPMLFQMPILFALWKTIEAYQGKLTNATFLWIGSFSNTMAKFFPSIASSIESWRGVCDITYTLKHKFPLWGDSLAAPDVLLLLLYMFSMYISSKISTVPTASANSPQQQSQKMMTTIMPLMLGFMFISFSSAFILYWLVFNVLSIVHQYYVMKTPYQLQPVKLPKEEIIVKTEQEVIQKRPRKRGQKKEAQTP